MQRVRHWLRPGSWSSRGCWCRAAAFALIATFVVPATHASDTGRQLAVLCPPVSGQPVLRLAAAPTKQQTVCDIAGLQALPQRELVTSLPPSLGPSGVHRWQGVSLRLLAERMGGGPGSVLQLAALNDYAVTVPWSDLLRYDPIVAYQRNGQALSVREKGPTMLIYPFDNHPELHAQQYLNRSIWQLHAITVN